MGTIYNDGTPKNKEYIKKCLEYLSYINEHRMFVVQAFYDLFGNGKIYTLPEGISKEDWYCAVEVVDANIKNHDMSKYSDEEFEGYRKYFYPTTQESTEAAEIPDVQNEINSEFEKAWIHHYTHNDHHPMYWRDEDGNPKNMPLYAILHMICDWQGMAYKFNSNVVDWYNSKAALDDKNAMTEYTRNIVEDLLLAIYNKEII